MAAAELATLEDQAATYRTWFAELGTSDRLRGQLEKAMERSATNPQPLAIGAGSAADDAVLVVPGVPVEFLVEQIRQGSGVGYIDMRPVEPADFAPTVGIPTGPYLLTGVSTGSDTLGVPPSQAAGIVSAQGRSALTLLEGVTLAALHPDILRARNCYQMLSSRDGSKRIPSLWVTKQGRPRLGWCFAGVPHSWLGAASCQSRIATTP